MQIDNNSDLLFIPPIQRIENSPDMLHARRNFLSTREIQARQNRQTDQLKEQSENARQDARRTAAADESVKDDAARALSREDTVGQQDAALETERMQLQEIQNATAHAQEQLEQENSVAGIADILQQMLETIQQMLEDKKYGAVDTTANAIPVTFPALTTSEVVDNGTVTPEEMLKQHLENLALYIKREAETAYHMQHPQTARPDATPVVPPLHHEDEYL
ncbi:MAG: hypothetical protein JXR76_12575 [Deltaproteobacteria bacterium]|nr:hypothetical protein [Deltaproteobacteria bacterium]